MLVEVFRVPCKLALTSMRNWSLHRLTTGAYYHECFLRGIPAITALIMRAPTHKGKPVPNADDEPNFHELSKTYPLPLPPACVQTQILPPVHAPMTAVGNFAIGLLPAGTQASRTTPVATTNQGILGRSTQVSMESSWQSATDPNSVVSLQQANSAMQVPSSMPQFMPTPYAATLPFSSLAPPAANPYTMALTAQNLAFLAQQGILAQGAYTALGQVPSNLVQSSSNQYATMPGVTEQNASSLPAQILLGLYQAGNTLNSPAPDTMSSMNTSQLQTLVMADPSIGCPRTVLPHELSTIAMSTTSSNNPVSALTSTATSTANIEVYEQGGLNSPPSLPCHPQQQFQATRNRVTHQNSLVTEPTTSMTECAMKAQNNVYNEPEDESDSENTPEGFQQDMLRFLDNYNISK